MAHQPIPPPQHHVILWIGVVGFAVLIGSFWVMGLGGLFRGAPSRARVLDDTARAWEQVRVEADATIARITGEQAERVAEETQKEALLGLLKNRLKTIEVASTTLTATTTAE